MSSGAVGLEDETLRSAGTVARCFHAGPDATIMRVAAVEIDGFVQW